MAAAFSNVNIQLPHALSSYWTTGQINENLVGLSAAANKAVADIEERKQITTTLVGCSGSFSGGGNSTSDKTPASEAPPSINVQNWQVIQNVLDQANTVRGKLDDVLINFQLYSTVDNIFDEQYLAGIKSFGFRLSKPRSVNVGAKYQF